MYKKHRYFIMLGMLSLGWLSHSALAHEAVISSYVKQQGTEFILDGKPFRFMGTNNYYMHYKSDAAIDDVLDDASEMGLKVIRIWGFMDGVDVSGYAIQPEMGHFVPGTQAKDALERLDYTISQAKKKGIRVVLVLTNNWPDFGGIPQYVKWIGSSEHDDFYRSPRLRQAYKDYVRFLLTHTNRYTGVPYNQEPAIMTFQLTNEARAQSDPSGNLLLGWVSEMSDYVRTLAPNHLISLGSEGFFNRPGHTDWTYNGKEGVDWERIIRLPNINYETFHMYTDQWGKKNAEQWGTQWIIDHLHAANEANKPTVLEEYGISTTMPYNRDLIYERWNRVAWEKGVAGSMFWILSGDDPDSPGGVYPDYDGYRILNDQSHTVQVLKDYAKRFAGEPVKMTDKVYFANPLNNKKLSDATFEVSVYPMLYHGQATRVTLFVGGKEFVLQDADGDGYFSALINSTTLGYGEHVFNAEVLKNDGSKVTGTIRAGLQKPIQGYQPVHIDDFTQDSAGWQPEGTWQASWGEPALEVSRDLGKPMLKANVSWSGKNDWEEVKIRHSAVKNFSTIAKLSFDVLLPAEGIFNGELRPYAILGDGGVKLDVDKNKQSVSALERVTLANQVLIKHHVEIELGEVGNSKPDMLIGLVGSKIHYTGPIYLDNVTYWQAKR